MSVAATSVRLCQEPEELYGPEASQAIGELLQPWLVRHMATPFELLHRADLAQRLDGAGTDLQQAVQKLAVPAALARGASVHEIIRQLQRLTDRALGRLTRRARERPTTDLDPAGLAALAEAAAEAPDGALDLGMALARRLGREETWGGKLAALIDLAETSPASEPARRLWLGLLERPVRELLRNPALWSELFGRELTLGETVAVDLALADHAIFAALARVQPSLAAASPPLPPILGRLGQALQQGQFPAARQDLHRRVLTDFSAKGRLRPDSASKEIETLRLLGAAMTAAAGPLMPQEDVREAVIARSGALLQPGFLGALIGPSPDAFAEMNSLALVLENVAGEANRRRAVRLLDDTAASRRLHRALLESVDPARDQTRLAALRHRIARASLGVAGAEALLARLDELEPAR